MAQKYFVQLKLGRKTYLDRVSTEGCSYVDDFKGAIKVKFPKVLKAYDSYEIVLFEADGTTKISAMDSIDQLNEKKMPLVVAVEPVEVQVEPAQISSTRHIKDYKQSKAFTSSRSFLTSIALELAEIYPITKERSPTGKEKPLTFGTIIHNAYQQNPDPIPQFRNNFKKLNEFFTADEWDFLDALNDAANGHLHRPLNPGSSTKQLILPSDFSGEEAICQRIAKKSNVVPDASHLIVKNEGSVSGGSPDADKKL